ncbi:MAG: hypothetical protein CMC82_02460 [Flavobacteriaceae bacterium]|nr:hypothetical protein [Flavobacteriaceae bacterium]|tara:strand:+ start:457 stop:816 length:360 start_codon:yes stop_codon:yes gene_type:complete
MAYLQPHATRLNWTAKLRQSGEKQAGKKIREKMRRTRHRNPFDLGRILCFKGNRIVVMTQDFNQYPDKENALMIFAYLWQGTKPDMLDWQRKKIFERFGRWVVARFGEYRIETNKNLNN